MLKNRKKSLAAITLAASVALSSSALTSCSDGGHVRRSGRNEHYRISERALGPTARGSAGTLCGRTIVVSIFASDPVYKWDFDCEDRKSMLNIRDSLKMACDYLTDAAGSYGSKTWFESDFISNPDLMYTCSFDDVITTWDAVVDGTTDDCGWDYIDDTIDEEALRDEFRADNVVYMFFMNTDAATDAISCTRNWYPGAPSDAEFVLLYNFDYGCLNPPAVYAHEILHTFGAPDLYMSDPSFGIDDSFLYYIQTDLTNEIMYTCSDRVTGGYIYDDITNEMSEVTAYYLGLIDECDTAEDWDLRRPYN